MLRSSTGAAAALCILLSAGSPAVASGSAPELFRVSPEGSVTTVADRLPPDLPKPASPSPPARATSSTISGTVTRTIERMVASGTISASKGADALARWRQAVSVRKATKGAAGTAIGEAIDSIVGIATRGDLTPSRLELAILTAQRNAQFFGTGRTPVPYSRVQFNGPGDGEPGSSQGRSDLVWQYYPGRGLQLQVLASFGVANGLWRAGATKPALKANLRFLLDELSSLASGRAGGVAWEYMFTFGGGKPPWASGMTQATAVQALARGSAMLGESKYLALARRALALFDAAPPSGVRLATSKGPWYLMYTFDRSQLVLNGFLQSLIGLDEMRSLTADPNADRLFRAAEPVARHRLPGYLTGGWTFYSPGAWDTVDYHTLTTGFLDELCRRTGKTEYCTTRDSFRALLLAPPRATIKTDRLAPGTAASLKTWLSKPAQATLEVLDQSSGRTILRSARGLQPGIHSWRISPPRTATRMAVTLTATDSNGRSTSARATVIGAGG